MEFSKVFPELCHYGQYQRLLYCFILMPIQLNYYCHIYSHLFIAQTPEKFWCQISVTSPPPSTSSSSLNDTYQKILDLQSKNSSHSNLIDKIDWNQLLFHKNTDDSDIRRYFFLPSRYFIRKKSFQTMILSNDSSQQQQQHESIIDLSKFLKNINHSFQTYLNQLSQCYQYNSTFSDLIQFHRQLFPLLLIWNNTNKTQHKSSIRISIPSIVECKSGWSYTNNANERRKQSLNVNYSIVTKVCFI